jgi:multimeric flavodoxin WrbA
MKAIAINGSPRKDWNTSIMLQSALDGAASAGAETKLTHLYDLDFKGCTSCFACKRKGSTCAGLCAQRDSLRDVLAEVLAGDVLILGSPIYFGDVTGEMRSFLERLMFPNITYNEFGKSVTEKPVNCGFVFTMNCPEQFMVNAHYDVLFENHSHLMGILKGKTEIVASYETLQFTDYSKMDAAMIDGAARAKRREEQFPVDCRNAFEMGARLATA